MERCGRMRDLTHDPTTRCRPPHVGAKSRGVPLRTMYVPRKRWELAESAAWTGWVH